MSPSRGAGFGVVIAAAGSGERLGGRPKAFVELLGAPLLKHALRPFLAHEDLRSAVVALPPTEAGAPPEWIVELAPRVRVVAGGDTRMRSVHLALEAVDAGVDRVLVHDAARVLVTREIIDRCLAGTRDGEGAVAGWPAQDTIKQVDSSRRVLDTPDRRALWAAQTPQGFPRDRLLLAYREAVAAGASATDDAEVFARFGGGTVRMVEGAPWNLKVTYADDLEVARVLLEKRAS
jgi:2-C-methyl-D-erythritol 4-phosphate cytidylyltransferase